MSRVDLGSAPHFILKELYRRTLKRPLKKLGHAIEDWVADQSPAGNNSIIDPKLFEWVERLEKNSGVIRQELLALLGGQAHLPNIQELSPRQMNLSKTDGWKTYFFFLLGHRIEESYKRCPETGKLLDSIPGGVALAFFSILAPGMHIKRHRGAYKGVVRCHLGLIVPEPRTAVRMQVGDEMVYWEEGKCVIFDDTHKHEVWNDTDSIRVVLLFDVYRPLPGWLTRVNKSILGLAYYAPEVRRLVRMQREWEARSLAPATLH